MAASQSSAFALEESQFPDRECELTFESTELLKVDRTDDVYYGELL